MDLLRCDYYQSLYQSVHKNLENRNFAKKKCCGFGNYADVGDFIYLHENGCFITWLTWYSNMCGGILFDFIRKKLAHRKAKFRFFEWQCFFLSISFTLNVVNSAMITYCHGSMGKQKHKNTYTQASRQASAHIFIAIQIHNFVALQWIHWCQWFYETFANMATFCIFVMLDRGEKYWNEYWIQK